MIGSGMFGEHPEQIMSTWNRKAELSRFPFFEPLEEMPPAQRDIAVVATNLRLGAGSDCMTFGIDPQVHRRLAAAFADRLQLNQ